MAFADKKGITVASGFKLAAESLLDVRGCVDTIAERDELVTLHAAAVGLQVFVKADNTLYTYTGIGWQQQTSGSAYVHPATHPATMITEDATHRFVTDAEKKAWNAKAETTLATNSNNGLMSKEYAAQLDGLNDILATKVDKTTTVNGHALTADVTLTADDVKAIPASMKGKANGVAELDANGTVPASQLPSYVDDVVEGYMNGGKLYKEEAHTTAITGEAGKIYVDLHTEKTYRWSGSTFVVISETLALGETASTAYRGDRGKIAYDHSQTAHAPANAQQNVQSDWAETDTGSDAYIKNKPTTMRANGGNADTVNNHTVKSDVPENAKFTDTTYEVFTKSTNGLVPKAGTPVTSDNAYKYFLTAAATWQSFGLAATTTASNATVTLNNGASSNAKAIASVIIPAASSTAAGLATAAMVAKLAGIADGANNYVHPSTHAATMITEDELHRFVTDAEKTTWNNKAEKTAATTEASGLMTAEMVTKLNGIADGATRYTHPATHPATMITEDSTHRFITDTERTTWNAKANILRIQKADANPKKAPVNSICLQVISSVAKS